MSQVQWECHQCRVPQDIPKSEAPCGLVGVSSEKMAQQVLFFLPFQPIAEGVQRVQVPVLAEAHDDAHRMLRQDRAPAVGLQVLHVHLDVGDSGCLEGFAYHTSVAGEASRVHEEPIPTVKKGPLDQLDALGFAVGVPDLQGYPAPRGVRLDHLVDLGCRRPAIERQLALPKEVRVGPLNQQNAHESFLHQPLLWVLVG